VTRPRPTISSPNKHTAYLRQAREFVARFAACEGVVGVLLTGGVARGYADHFSELDLAVYLTRPHFEDWTRRGLAPFPEGDSCVDGWHVDFDYCCFEDESDAEWEHVKRWDRSYAVVLHDPQGLMQQMLTHKAILTEEEKQRLTSRHLILYGDYLCSLVAPSWLHRGDLRAAHHCLNVALDNLIKAVFLANDELIPFDKWTLNLSYTLEWTPPGWRERVDRALTVRELSRAEVERRCGLIGEFFAECQERLVGGKTEGLATIEARKLEMLHSIRKQGAMPAAEFDRRFGLRRAIQSPLFHLLRREIRAEEEWLVFHEGRLEEHAARDFEGFLEWDRALLRVLTGKTAAGTPAGGQATVGELGSR
jgi:predicted nucleotidyltransferase